MLLDSINKLLSTKKRGEAWVEQVAPALIEVMTEIKEIEGKKNGETLPLKEKIMEVEEKYKGSLKVLNEIEGQLRTAVVMEHEGTEPVYSPDGGKLVFVEDTQFEIPDVGKVDKAYLMTVVDTKKVKDTLKKGIVNIKGVNLVTRKSVRVFTK